MRRLVPLAFLLSSLCPLCLCDETSAAADPGLKTPYQLRIVLHFADHRLLTDVFQDRVERELRDGLQASFGDLVRVEVARDHPRLKEVLENGLKALDGWKERSDYKTHFVLIDFAGAEYLIQARQHDGLTGLAGPVVRRDRTRDREFVAKAAALMVEQDFGLIGSFDAWPKPSANGEDQPATVRLRGAGLDVPLDRWIHEGDVFSVVQMPGGDKAPGAEVKGALLLVDKPPAEGSPDACVCRVFRRYPDPPRGGPGGFRCVKLGTVRAPLRLKLQQAHADGSAGPLENALTVEMRHRSFDKDESGKLAKTTGTDDVIDTTADAGGDNKGVFDNVAFVKVLSSDGAARARLPIPLLDDQPIVMVVNVDASAGSTFAFEKTAWESGVNDAWAVQRELFKEINDLTSKEGKRGDALKLIRDGLQRTRDDATRLAADRAKLVKDNKAPLNLPAADERLKKLQQGEVELNTLLTQLEKIDKEENDPVKKKYLEQVALGKRLEADLEIDKAIALYDQLLKDGYQDAGVEKHLAELRESWKPKSDKHKEARRFVYEDWPALDDAGLKAKLPTAQEAFKTCKEAGDKITVQRMLNAAEAHAVRMGKELRELNEVNVEDEKQIRLIKEVTAGLKDLAADMVKYVSS